MSFSDDFVWGVATSSYQIEGAWNVDGKGESVWDAICTKPGKIMNEHHGDIACDHYHRYQEDVANIRSIGVKAYRFSISWPRVLPEGVGDVNQDGLAFYDRLVDELLEKDIDPWVTLFHWDYPLALFRKGGWLNRNSVAWFAEYSRVIVDKLSDRVTNWITLNEPQCFIGSGHFHGRDAPALKLPLSEALLACHHALMAHGESVRVIREYAKEKPRVGWAPVGVVKYPSKEDEQTINAARREMFRCDGDDPFWTNTWYSDPVIHGHYPNDGLEKFKQHMNWYKEDDLAVMCQPIDFYGVNIYNGEQVGVDDSGECYHLKTDVGAARTAFDWPVTPEALRWGVTFLHERYDLPIYVTENGLSNTDWVHVDGNVHDPQRIDFLRRYIHELEQAADIGVDISGYFQWSLMDNFEWLYGYTQRFGLVHVDFMTLKRTLKDSAYWYRDVIKNNGVGDL